MSADRVRLRVSVPDQRVELCLGDEVAWWAQVSTSRFGVGTEAGSFKTPPGLHRVAEKIGDEAPLGTRFVSRLPTAELWTPDAPPVEEDWVLTRILWLAGTTPENANSQARYIYFHGTNREDRIGTPASHGCVRLRNAEMIELFDQVEVGTAVEILG